MSEMTAYEQTQADLRTSPRTWLVTGCAGFIGSNLLEALLKLDQRVVGLDNFSTGYQKNLDEVRSLVTPAQWERFSFIKGDIRDLATCQKACSSVDYALQQAALGSVPRSINDPIASHDSNVTGFLNMLVSARDQKVKRFVYASSSSVYGDHPDLPKVEDRVGRPLSPYAATKAMCEMYAEVFARVYGIEAVGLRYFNVFGPRQDPNGAYAAVIPKWINAMLKGEPIYINGDGETSRDFCYVANVVQANILAATAEAAFMDPCDSRHEKAPIKPSHQIFNVAVGERTTLRMLHELIRKELHSHRPKLADETPTYRGFRSGDVRHSLADIKKAAVLLKYDSTVPLVDGIGTTVSHICERAEEPSLS